jgi:hypothetical protein
MRLTCRMKVQHLSVDGDGCRATLRCLVGEGGADFSATGAVEFVIYRPKSMKGLLTLGEIYDVEFTPVPEKTA